jgi:hypothetical protein
MELQLRDTSGFVMGRFFPAKMRAQASWSRALAQIMYHRRVGRTTSSPAAIA